jgi:hypothetical protein
MTRAALSSASSLRCKHSQIVPPTSDASSDSSQPSGHVHLIIETLSTRVFFCGQQTAAVFVRQQILWYNECISLALTTRTI